MRVAVLGTGTMGVGMVRSLLRSGIAVTAWNRHHDRAAPLVADGARVVESSMEAVRDADVIITMLFDESAVREVAEEFLDSVSDGAIWMQCATVGPAGIRRLADLAAAHGVRLIDAPLVGTKKPAEDGTLVALVSGDADRIERLSPVLAAIAGKTINSGTEIGAASALKLACNAWVATLTVATAQSLAMCTAFGLDPGLFLSVIEGGPADSAYAQLKGRMMINQRFPASFAIAGVVKDLGLMLDAISPTAALETAGSEAAASEAAGSDAAWLRGAVSDRLLQPVYSAFAEAAKAGYSAEDIAAVSTSFSR